MGTGLAMAHRLGAMGAGRLAVVQADAGALAGGLSGCVCGRPSPRAGLYPVWLPELLDGGGSLYVRLHAWTGVGPGMGTGPVAQPCARHWMHGYPGSLGDTEYVADALLAHDHVLIRTCPDRPSWQCPCPQ